jgi:fumarylacetoacetase
MSDSTHDPARRSWVQSANGHGDFPIQNLPLGVFNPPAGGKRGGVAIGDSILDLAALDAEGVFTGAAARALRAACGETLNPYLALSAAERQALRRALGDLLDIGAAARAHLLHEMAECTLHLPARIGDYTDFFAGIYHATNTG